MKVVLEEELTAHSMARMITIQADVSLNGDSVFLVRYVHAEFGGSERSLSIAGNTSPH